MKKLLFLELNEFNFDLLKEAAQGLNLKHVLRLLSLYRTETFTDDSYASDYLEPWVQWVSIHTGQPSSQHQIKHLGDVPHLGCKQLWEELSDMGISSGIWGAMNASRNNAKACRFFLPDPWTKAETAFPAELNDLLEPLHYYSQNYTNRSTRKALTYFTSLLFFLKRHKCLSSLFKQLPRLAGNMLRFKLKSFVFISLFDFISTNLFLSYRKQFQPDFSLIFLNSIAHLQHHHWTSIHGSWQLSYGFTYLNRILGEIFESLGDDTTLIVTNGLSQENTNEDKPWILYRQNDQKTFLSTLGFNVARVEPLMTHDALIYFNDPEECQRAKKALEGATVEGAPLFLVESYTDAPLKLFYRLVFTDEVADDTVFIVEKKSYRLLDLFTKIVRRTGKHIPHGTLFCSEKLFPSTLKNHEIYPHILQFFKNG